MTEQAHEQTGAHEQAHEQTGAHEQAHEQTGAHEQAHEQTGAHEQAHEQTLEQNATNKLTNVQQAAFDMCYTELSSKLQDMIQSYKNNEHTQMLFYMFLIGVVVKQVETTVLRGADKKAVAVQLGRRLIVDIVHDAGTEATVLGVYDAVAGGIIDTVVNVASNVNTSSLKPKSCCNVM